MRTGDVTNAGTDAKVHLQFIGDKKSDKFELDKSDGHKNMFERGKVDTFTLKSVDLGQIKKIKIGHNNAGLAAGWFLDLVEIAAPALGKKYVFKAERWLAKNEGDGKIEIEVEGNENSLEQFSPELSFKVRTFTSNE